MIEKIKEIDKALKAECYHCALALALTLPDICGKVAYPELAGKENSAKRYQRWFDEYVSECYMLPDENVSVNDGNKFLNGYACYLLRCAFLHNGNYTLKEQNNKIKIEKFKLHFDKTRFYPHNSIVVNENSFELVNIDVCGLCRNICFAATNFYRNIEDKTQFTDELIEDASIHSSSNIV